MVESLQNIFAESFSGFSFFAVILISMLPICEGRIGVPFGMAKEIWGENALSPIMSFVAAFIGSTLISALILLCLKPLFKKLKNSQKFKNFVAKFEKKFTKEATQVVDDKKTIKNKRLNQWVSVMLFVALPAPLTGVWTGSGIAAYTNMNFWQSFSAIAVGNFIACLLIYLVCTIFKNSVLFILIASVVMIIGYALYTLISKKLGQKQNQPQIK